MRVNPIIKYITTIVNDNNYNSLDKFLFYSCDTSKKSGSYESSFDLNSYDVDGMTPLMVASCYGFSTCLDILLNYGANPNVQDKQGITAVMFASNGYPECLKSLLVKKPNLNLKDAKGWTAIVSAVDCGNLKCVQLLLDHGADINVQDNEGVTPLIYSCRYFSRQEFIRLLLEYGADINLKDNNGWTALMWASQSSNIEVIEMLLEYGADVDVLDNQNMSVLDYAIKNQSKFEDLFSSYSVGHYIIK